MTTDSFRLFVLGFCLGAYIVGAITTDGVFSLSWWAWIARSAWRSLHRWRRPPVAPGPRPPLHANCRCVDASPCGHRFMSAQINGPLGTGLFCTECNARVGDLEAYDEGQRV